jgi:hypothetical protein
LVGEKVTGDVYVYVGATLESGGYIRCRDLPSQPLFGGVPVTMSAVTASGALVPRGQTLVHVDRSVNNDSGDFEEPTSFDIELSGAPPIAY